MISTFINALTGLSGISIDLTVPAFTVDMQGAIMTVPMAVVWWTIGLYYDDRRRFCLRRKENPLPSAFVPGDSVAGISVKKVGR